MHSNLKPPNPPDVWLVGLENLRTRSESPDPPHIDIDDITASDSEDEDEDRARLPAPHYSTPFDEQYYHTTAEMIVEELENYGLRPRYQTLAELLATIDLDPVVLEHKMPMPESVWAVTETCACSAHYLHFNP